MPSPFLSDAEVDDICDGLTQHAAMVRHLERLGLKVDRKPNGRPLVWRPAETQETGPAHTGVGGMNVVGLQAWAKARGRHGAKAQGR